MKIPPCLVTLLVLGSLGAGAAALASEDSLVIATYSSVHNGYQRQKMPDGSFQREYYALAKGVYLPGRISDHSIDDVKFPPLAGLLAQYLARKNYYMAQDKKSAGLLLIVTWGTTIPFDSGVYEMALNNLASAVSQAQGAAGFVPTLWKPLGPTRGAPIDPGAVDQMLMFEAMRNKAREYNARVLGYVDEWNRWKGGLDDVPSLFAGAGTAFYDLRDDLENERYFVVICAYDFKAAAKEGKRRLLWATRVSIDAHGNRFDRDVSAMLAKASRHFGQTSGLQRQYYEGVVTLGEMKVLGYDVPTTPAPTSTKPENQK